MIDIVPPSDIDPAWWAEKTHTVSVEYCPQCRVDIDPRDSHFVPAPCEAHRSATGSADLRAVEKREPVLVYIPEFGENFS